MFYCGVGDGGLFDTGALLRTTDLRVGPLVYGTGVTEVVGVSRTTTDSRATMINLLSSVLRNHCVGSCVIMYSRLCNGLRKEKDEERPVNRDGIRG